MRPKLVHSLSFSTKHLEETFATYQDVFKVFPYFRINITQAKVVSHLVYELKDKNLVKSETYMEFKESLNTIFFKELKFKQFKTSCFQSYRLDGQVSILELKFDEDVEVWYKEYIKPLIIR